MATTTPATVACTPDTKIRSQGRFGTIANNKLPKRIPRIKIFFIDSFCQALASENFKINAGT
jgi:hypothetical protein